MHQSIIFALFHYLYKPKLCYLNPGFASQVIIFVVNALIMLQIKHPAAFYKYLFNFID